MPFRLVLLVVKGSSRRRRREVSGREGFRSLGHVRGIDGAVSDAEEDERDRGGDRVILRRWG